MTALEMIVAASEHHADRVAIEDGAGKGVTYAKLIARARRAAKSITAGSVVEIEATRTVDFIVECLAAWIAGAAWVPIDPDEPAWRRAAIRADLPARCEGLAYVIATSGSSGAPKLVMISHRGLPVLLRAQIEAFDLVPGARALWLHAPRFDASVSDWGTALVAGATLVIPAPGALAAPERLRGEFARRGITHVDLPPALLAHVPPSDPSPGLRVVVLGGEPCPVELVCELARRTRVVVVYGPTEATVCSSLVVVDPERWHRPLIGDPLPDVTYRVIDGELWIGGDCLALGYAGDAEATAHAFVELDGQRMYRTGDRVEPCDGGLAFLGRSDRQHKIAGVRVELDEIEAVLRRAPGIREAAVAVYGDRARLVAFVDGEVEPAAIRAWMRQEAPAWMVPSRVIVGALPRTPTGKIDHAALARRELPIPAPVHSDPLERELAVLWCNALGVEAVTDERLRDAGGDSLAQLTLQAAVTAHGIPLDSSALAADPTFAELVAAARDASAVSVTVADCEARGLAALAARHERDRAELATAPPIPAARKGPAGAGLVLVTGATGRLGSAILRAWRAHDPRPIVALVRAPDAAAARKRLPIDDASIEVICGDLARPYFGLGRDVWYGLAHRVSAVVHAAAHIELAAGWDAHAAANVGGTAEVARFVATRARIAWHYVSTLSVFVGTDHQAGVHRESSVPVPGAIAYGGYAQTKIAAEAIARSSRGRLAPTTILRLGLLVGDSLRADDQLAMMLRGLARLGAVPAGAGQLCLDVTPVGHAARAMVALATHAEWAKLDDTHHVASARGVTFGQLVAGLRGGGVALVELSPAAWVERARTRLVDPDIAMAYLSLGRVLGGVAPPSFDLFLATGAEFDVARTTQLLAQIGVTVPEIDQSLIDQMVTSALRAKA